MSSVAFRTLQDGRSSIVDSDDLVYMVHFVEPARDDPEAIHVRGDVLSYSDDSVVCGSCGLIEEVAWTPTATNVLIPEPIYSVPPATMIRVFCYQGRWYMVTNRRLNATTSRWGGGNESFGALFIRMANVPMGDLRGSGLDPAQTYTFLMAYEEWIPADQRGVYWLRMSGQRSLSLPNAFTVRELPEVDRTVAATTEPMWGYLWTDGWTWTRITSDKYRMEMWLQGDCSDPRERYLQLVNHPDQSLLAKYLVTRPSVADMKLADDDAWTTVLKKLLEDVEFRTNVIKNRGAFARWDALAVQWQQQSIHSVQNQSYAIRLKVRALQWWHREKNGSHFRL